MADDNPPAAQESEPISPGEMESLQAGARWLVGASAAVLAVLVASVQLSSLADVAGKGGQQLFWTLVLCGVALLAVGVLLIFSARVLVRPGLTLTKLSTDQKWKEGWRKEELDTYRSMLVPDTRGAATVTNPPSLQLDSLHSHYSHLLKAWFELHESKSAEVIGDLLDQDSEPRTRYDLGTPADVEQLEGRLKLTASAVTRVVALANLLVVRRRYRRLVYWQLPLFGVIAVLAVLGLVWLAAENAEVSITAPVQVDVKFNDADLLRDAGLPVTCQTGPVRGVAINGTLSKPEVSSLSTTCPLSQTEIPPELGTVVPVLPPK